MITLKNSCLALTMKEDGTHVVLEDLVRKERWLLDEATRYVSDESRRLRTITSGPRESLPAAQKSGSSVRAGLNN